MEIVRTFTWLLTTLKGTWLVQNHIAFKALPLSGLPLRNIGGCITLTENWFQDNLSASVCLDPRTGLIPLMTLSVRPRVMKLAFRWLSSLPLFEFPIKCTSWIVLPGTYCAFNICLSEAFSNSDSYLYSAADCLFCTVIFLCCINY